MFKNANVNEKANTLYKTHEHKIVKAKTNIKSMLIIIYISKYTRVCLSAVSSKPFTAMRSVKTFDWSGMSRQRKSDQSSHIN